MSGRLASRRVDHDLASGSSRPRLPRRKLTRRRFPKQDRHLVTVEHRPARVIEQSFRQSPLRSNPHDLDLFAVRGWSPRQGASQDIDVFEDRLLAEELEAVVEVRTPRRLAFGRDQTAPVLFVKKMVAAG